MTVIAAGGYSWIRPAVIEIEGRLSRFHSLEVGQLDVDDIRHGRRKSGGDAYAVKQVTALVDFFVVAGDSDRIWLDLDIHHRQRVDSLDSGQQMPVAAIKFHEKGSL